MTRTVHVCSPATPDGHCRDCRWDRLAAAGGRLLAEYDGCDATGHYVQDGIYRFDYPSGSRTYLCPPHWTDAW